MVTATANDPEKARRNNHRTSVTRAAPSSMLCETVWSVVSTRRVRS